MQLRTADNTRTLSIETRTDMNRIFLAGEQGWCMEFDRPSLVAAIAQEFGLVPFALLGLATLGASVADML